MPRSLSVPRQGDDSKRDGMEHSIDWVLDAVRAEGRDFLLDLIGSKQAGLKQIFSSASEQASLIIEYVRRCGGITGFFNQQNLAVPTHAAGVAEALIEMQDATALASA